MSRMLITDPIESERLRREARRIVQESWDEAVAFSDRIEKARRNAELNQDYREYWEKKSGPILTREAVARRSRV